MSKVGELRFVPARSRDVLNEIVAADRKKVGAEILDGQRGRRHLDHHAKRRQLRFPALATQFLDGLLEKRTAAIQFLRHRDHGDHHLEVSGHGSAGQRLQLQPKYVKVPQRQPHATHAKKWIDVSGLRQAGDRLVTSSVERADRHWLAGGPFNHAPVDLVLLFLGRKLFAPLKQKLGPHQADAVDVGGIEVFELGEAGDIDHDPDKFTAGCKRRPIECSNGLSSLRLLGTTLMIDGSRIRISIDDEKPCVRIDPDTDTRAVYHQRRAEQSEARQAVAAFNGPALTASGELVRVMINVTGLAELEDLDPAHVDGIGLMRTEFLFQAREKLPTE